MGITNLRYGLEEKIAKYRGELEAIREEVQVIEAGVGKLSALHHRAGELERLINYAEGIIKDDHPDFKATTVKASRPRKWKNPYPPGEMGRTALTVLREADEWMRPSKIARVMLERLGRDPDDRTAREKLANSISNYLKKHEGDLVESRGDYAKEWTVIREISQSIQKECPNIRIG